MRESGIGRHEKNILYAEGKIFLVCEMKEKESTKGT